MASRTLAVSLLLFITGGISVLAQGWVREGALRRWNGSDITSKYSGCLPTPGNPIVQASSSLVEVDLQEGTTVAKSMPEGTWRHVARQPRLMAQVNRSSEGEGSTSIAFYDLWAEATVANVTLDISTQDIALDITDTWVAADGSEGCVVFSPTASTPEDSELYVIAFFTGTEVTFSLSVKPKVDVDIYVRPDTQKGILCYLRGNGISFPPSEEEVFTNASYLVYEPDGTRDQWHCLRAVQAVERVATSSGTRTSGTVCL